jgi:hypothetical protein
MASAEPPISMGELRQHVLMPLIGNPFFSEAEQLRANHFVHECEDIARLLRWGKSVQAEIDRREAAAQVVAARVRRQHVLHSTLQQLRPTGFRGHCPHCPVLVWPTRFSAPDAGNRRAGTFDRQVAAHFQPADSLTLATLLSRPSR